jgi:hypothetical protein
MPCKHYIFKNEILREHKLFARQARVLIYALKNERNSGRFNNFGFLPLEEKIKLTALNNMMMNEYPAVYNVVARTQGYSGGGLHLLDSYYFQKGIRNRYRRRVTSWDIPNIRNFLHYYEVEEKAKTQFEIDKVEGDKYIPLLNKAWSKYKASMDGFPLLYLRAVADQVQPQLPKITPSKIYTKDKQIPMKLLD